MQVKTWGKDTLVGEKTGTIQGTKWDDDDDDSRKMQDQ